MNPSIFSGKMAREKKFASSGGAKETPAGKLLETIIEDVITANAMTFAQWHALSANPLVPLAIPVSQGGQYRVTQAGVDAAHLLSQQSWKSREALREVYRKNGIATALWNLDTFLTYNRPYH